MPPETVWFCTKLYSSCSTRYLPQDVSNQRCASSFCAEQGCHWFITWLRIQSW